MTVSIGVAVLVVMATVVPVPVSTVSPPVRLSTSTDSTALIMGGTAIPTPDDYYIETVKSHFIAPTHPGQDINYVAVTTPEEFWPLTGLRLIAPAIASPSIWGPGGAAWPDEPWWKLSGLFDLTIDQSIQAGVADLEQAMTEHGNDHLVIYGYSQGAIVANMEKQKLAEQYPPGTKAPDIDFVLSGDLNVPNGGLHARFPGLYVPILDWSFNGPEPTNTPFHTDVITRQYDGLADFPLYPLNLVADLNAVLGVAYVHLNDLDVSLPADPTTSPAYQGTHGDTSYYFFKTQDLPLFAPLRTLGVPESLIDVVEPFFRVLVELGYDRSIPPWQPTPARLIPPLNLATVATDLVNAIGQGINNALALIGSPPLLKIPAPDTTNSIDTLATTGINAVDTNTTNICGANTVAASGTNTTDINTTDINTTDTNSTDINTTGTNTVGATGTHTVGASSSGAKTGTRTLGASGTNTSGARTLGATGTQHHRTNTTGASSNRHRQQQHRQ
jgi:PE-PPE domain